MDVGQTSEKLVHVQLDEGDWDRLLAFGVLSGHLVDGFRDVLEDEVQVDLVLLLAGSVEEVKQLDYVAMLQPSHNLKREKIKNDNSVFSVILSKVKVITLDRILSNINIPRDQVLLSQYLKLN